MGSRSRSRSPRKERSRSPRKERSRSPRRERSRSPRRSRSRSRGGGGDRRKGGRCYGRAQRWNERGFGFIEPEHGGDEMFCHVSAIKDGNMLREGDEVSYDEEFDERRGKYLAKNVEGGVYDEGGKGGGKGGGGGSQECWDFKKGTCNRGSSCRFTHDGGDDRYDGGGGRDRYDGGRGRSRSRSRSRSRDRRR